MIRVFSSHRQRNTPRQNNPHHAEAEHHHHHYGPETRNSPRRADDTGRYGGDGGAEAEYVCHAGVGRRDDHGPMRYTDGRDGESGSGRGHIGRGREDTSGAGGAYQPQFPGRYHNDGGNETGVGDEDRNNRRQLHGGGGAGFTAKVPRDSSSSGSSDQRSNSRRIIHVGLGEENKSTTQMGYDKAKRVELSSGKHGQTSRSVSLYFYAHDTTGKLLINAIVGLCRQR